MNYREYPELAISIIAIILLSFGIIYEVVGHFERNPSCFDCSDDPLDYDPYADVKEYVKEIEKARQEKDNEKMQKARLGFLEQSCLDGIKKACEDYNKSILINQIH